MRRKLRFGEVQYLSKEVVHFELLFVNSFILSISIIKNVLYIDHFLVSETKKEKSLEN